MALRGKFVFIVHHRIVRVVLHHLVICISFHLVGYFVVLSCYHLVLLVLMIMSSFKKVDLHCYWLSFLCGWVYLIIKDFKAGEYLLLVAIFKMFLESHCLIMLSSHPYQVG